MLTRRRNLWTPGLSDSWREQPYILQSILLYSTNSHSSLVRWELTTSRYDLPGRSPPNADVDLVIAAFSEDLSGLGDWVLAVWGEETKEENTKNIVWKEEAKDETTSWWSYKNIWFLDRFGWTNITMNWPGFSLLTHQSLIQLALGAFYDIGLTWKVLSPLRLGISRAQSLRGWIELMMEPLAKDFALRLYCKGLVENRWCDQRFGVWMDCCRACSESRRRVVVNSAATAEVRGLEPTVAHETSSFLLAWSNSEGGDPNIAGSIHQVFLSQIQWGQRTEPPQITPIHQKVIVPNSCAPMGILSIAGYPLVLRPARRPFEGPALLAHTQLRWGGIRVTWLVVILKPLFLLIYIYII